MNKLLKRTLTRFDSETGTREGQM